MTARRSEPPWWPRRAGRAVRSAIGAAAAAAVVAAMTAITWTLWWAGSDALAAAGNERVGLDTAAGALAAVVGLGCVSWICVSVVVTLVAAAPGRVGQLGGAAAQRIAPVVIRRVVAAALGVGLAGTSVGGALAAPPAAPPSATATPAAVAASWARASATPPPLLDRPTVPSAPDVVIVEPGDCLWSIAARRLGAGASAAQIDAEWRRWYATNRGVIGADPNLILPGQRLVAPT